MNWYGIKTIFRLRATGRPKAKDRYYDPTTTLIEERVVIYRARTPSAAITKAERDAEAYAAATHQNPYGQTVRTYYLGCCDAYELFDELRERSGKEVYSRTEVAPSSESDTAICRRLLGHESKAQHRLRRNILNAEFTTPAPRT